MSRLGTNVLFSMKELSTDLMVIPAAVRSTVNNLPPSTLMDTEEAQLVGELAAGFELRCPVLDRAGIRMDVSECKADDSGNPDRFIRDRSQPFMVDATQVQLFVPFDGDRNMFLLRPSQWLSNLPRADLREHDLVLTAIVKHHNAEQLKAQLLQQVDLIDQMLGFLRAQIEEHNQRLPTLVRQHVQERRARLESQKSLAAGLGFELKRREDPPRTYAEPAVRRPPPLALQAAAAGTGEPEPVLTTEGYKQILTDLSAMMRVVELNPRAFGEMDEEDLRWILLVPLNLYWEGGATGETFNYKGKTDILIKVKGKNVFIAECKIWKGPQSLLDALSQILSYSSWGDTKAAVLMFSRRDEFSTVLEKIPETTKQHAQFATSEGPHGETGFRFTFRNPEDSARRIQLTVLAFNVPN